jgi:tyrosine-protein kinase Etk/Wzc
MIQKQHTNPVEKGQVQPDLVSPRKILFLVTSRWYFFLVVMVLALALAYLYNRFAVPVFRVSATILMEEADQARMQGMENHLLDGIGLSPAATNLENQLYVLTSWSLVSETMQELPFETDVFTRGLSRKISFYPMYPLRLVPESPGMLPYE